MFLFFDTETTGVPKNYQAPASDLENWPRLVQIAWAKYDENGQEVLAREHIIRPEGFVIPEQASAVHGISTEKAMQEGEDLESILGDFALELSNSGFLIAHNMAFDEKIIGAEFIRKNVGNKLMEIPKLCTMQSTVNFCALPGNYGYKWPRLSELHIKLFGHDFEDAHDALVDVNACARCFFELLDKGIMKF